MSVNARLRAAERSPLTSGRENAPLLAVNRRGGFSTREAAEARAPPAPPPGPPPVSAGKGKVKSISVGVTGPASRPGGPERIIKAVPCRPGQAQHSGGGDGGGVGCGGTATAALRRRR